MAYGTVKVDSITFTNGGIDQTVTVSGIVQSISGNITATGTIQAATIIGTSTVSGATVTGDSGQYGNLNSISGVFTTQLSGATITGDTGQYTTLTGISGVFTTQISGATITGNTIQASTVTGISGVYTTQLSGATITGNTGNFTTVTGISGVFTTQISGTTITGDTGQYTTLTGISGVFTTQVSGTTVTGDAGSFTTVTGGVATITSGVFALGTNALPSISFSSDPNTGIYSPGADQVAISTNGTGKLFIDSAGKVGLGTSSIRGSSLLDVRGDIAFGANAIYYGILGYNAGTGYLETTSSDGGFKWIRASGPTTSMTLDNSGRLGVGTTSPNQPLEVNGIIRGGSYQFSTSSTTTAEYLGFSNSNGPTLEFWGSASANAGSFLIKTAGTECARIDSSGRLLVGTPSDSGGALLQVNGDRIRVGTAKTPASATDTGTAGEICWDASYVYVCTATNTWKRSALSTW